jgi:hypothetical protein
MFHYEKITGFPGALFTAGDGRVVGTWIMGNELEYHLVNRNACNAAVKCGRVWWRRYIKAKQGQGRN